jgi:50S ribosome-binding GTPase
VAMPNPPYSPCVYLGKVGLLGGMQESTSQRVSQVSGIIPQEGWMKGPTMDLSSGETLTYPYALSLPPGARFTGYRLQPGSVVERASWATWYVGADSRDVIGNIDLRQSIGGRSAGMLATVADVIPLGSVEVTTGRTSENNQRRAHVSSHSHAALILYGNTKRNKLFRRKSRLNIALDVSYVIEASPATSPESPLSPPENILSTPPDRSPTDPSATSSSIPTVSSVSSATPVVVAPAFPYSPHSAPVTATPPPSAKEDKNTACVPPALDIDFSSARSLHKRRMSGLAPTLTESERIELITMYVSDGAKRAEEIVGKNAVIVIGNTGAGKSTWLNYLMGCRMILTPLRRSSMANAAPSEVCPVVPFPIGHTKQSETFMPAIALEPMASDPIAYCDCPGFLDNRGAEINIANAVNIRRILQAARSVRIIILISDVALIADRSRGLTDMLRICTHLFGSLDTIKRHKESLLLGVTQSSVDTKIEELQGELREGTPEIMQILSDRLFLYDPLDRGGADFWNRAKCVANIKALVPMRSTGDLFQTVLDARDEQTLRNIVEQEGKRASDFLSRGQYSQAATCWQTLQRLRVIDKLSVERLLHESEERILGKLSGLEVDFKDACYFHDMGKAKKLLDVFEQITHHFSREANTFDLPSLDALQDHYAKVQHRKQQEEERDREHNAARIQAAKDKQELLNIIASQKAEMERTQQELARQHAAMREELQLERSGREEAYEQSLAATQKELELALKRHEEALAMVQMLSTEESNRLSEEKEALREEYAEHIKHMQEEWLAEKAVYDLQLAAQQAAQAKKQEEVQSKIDLLSRQHKNEAQHLASLRIPAQAFGAEEWEKYFGEVGEAPPLPSDMVTILDGPCPFWTNKKVRDTHLLVLIPATVGGVPLTLNLLGELIQRPKNGGHRTEYRRYDDLVKAQIGEESPPRPYWLLMTRDVLPKSRSKTYDAQKALVAAHASKLGLPYEMPPALAAATAILLHHAREGERLFGDDPCTFTRCQEKVANNQYPVVVGGFSSGGLVVDYHFSHSLVHYSHDGVSCLRKF